MPAISLLDPDAAPKLDAALREFGFFELVDHGLPSTLIDAAFDASRRFFALPEPTKALWHIERSPFKHGFDPIGWQALDPDRPFDLKESFYIGAGRGADDPVVRAGALNQGPNQWPDETEHTALAGFRVACERYADHAQALVQRLLRLCAQALALAPGHFEASTRAPTCTLRLLHYPPQAASGSGLPGQLGCGAHTDWGALTLLAQDDAGGLQVQTPGGEWIDLLPRPQALVVNAGDMMPRWTNDRWRSAPHRVVNRRAGARRYSIAYFFDLDHDAWIAPLPGCASAENPARYNPVQAGAHLLEMYRRTTLKA